MEEYESIQLSLSLSFFLSNKTRFKHQGNELRLKTRFEWYKLKDVEWVLFLLSILNAQKVCL